MYQGSWVYHFVFELVYDVVVGLLLFALFSAEIGVVFSIALAVSAAVLGRLYGRFVQRVLPDSKLLRLPLLTCEGVVAEKHLYPYPVYFLLRKSILFNAADGQQIKAYVSMGASKSRRHLDTFSAGDKGTLYYRKHKNYCYFERFKPDAEE